MAANSAGSTVGISGGAVQPTIERGAQVGATGASQTGLQATRFNIVSNGLDIPDLSATAASVTTLLTALTDVPAASRVFVEKFWVQPVGTAGPVAWASGTGVALEDSNSAPFAWIPESALGGITGTIAGVTSLPKLQFDGTELGFDIVLTVASFVAGTGVVTFPATSFISTKYVNNAVGVVIGGTGIGQAFRIASNTATALTPVGGASAFPVALDATSIVAVSYWSATAGAATTSTYGGAGQAQSVTPFVASALQGLSMVYVTGTGAGQADDIGANTSSLVTGLRTLGTAPDGTTLTRFTNNKAMLGSVDLCIGRRFGGGLGKGLQIRRVSPGAATGTPLRYGVSGYII